jgi:hypothetical protein
MYHLSLLLLLYLRPRLKSELICAELTNFGMQEVRDEWGTYAHQGVCTMSPTLGAWLLKTSTKEAKEGTGKNSLRTKDLIEILLPSEAEEAVTRELGQHALQQHRLITAAKGLSI